MKTTKVYIEEAKNKLGIVSDYALSKRLGITKQAVGGYQSGTRVMDNYTAAKLAEALEINPLEVISAASAEREKDDKKREFWQKLARTSAAALVTIPLVFSELEPVEKSLNYQEYALCAV